MYIHILLNIRRTMCPGRVGPLAYVLFVSRTAAHSSLTTSPSDSLHRPKPLARSPTLTPTLMSVMSVTSVANVGLSRAGGWCGQRQGRGRGVWC